MAKNWIAQNTNIKDSEEFQYLTKIQEIEDLARSVKMEINYIHELEWINIKKSSPKTKFDKWQEVENLLKSALQILENG